MNDADDEPRFSRSGNTHPDGKTTEEIKVKLPEDLKTAIAGLAAIHGKTTSEYVRDRLTQFVYGELHVIRSRASHD